MGYTTHGYYIAGVGPDVDEPTMKEECGGPGVCVQCTDEAGVDVTDSEE